MKNSALRALHRRIGSKELFSYWHATELLYFRRLFGLKYRPNSEEESAAFYDWVSRQYSAGSSRN